MTIRLDRIVTRSGDAGTTSLGDGTRVAKTDARIAALGAVDETNAAIGLIRTHTVGLAEDAALQRVQHDLFDLGADLAVPLAADRPALRITPLHLQRLEAEVTEWNRRLAPLTSFVLPGGQAGAAAAHLARTIARRAERTVWALAAQQPAVADGARYLNRLADHLFVVSRILNDDGRADVLWQPQAGIRAEGQ